MDRKVFQISKVISGGQTGVDQAALRAAAALGIPVGGWCPPGRLSEDGPIPDAFPLRETPDDRSPAAPDIARSQRTEWNVRDSDGILVLKPASLQRHDLGTSWAEQCAALYRKPMLIADPAEPNAVSVVRRWVAQNRIATLNVAGPSEHTCPGIGILAEELLFDLLGA